MTPFLKWAGGKRWLVERDLPIIPKSFDRYLEPFLGGGAVFFALRPRMAILSDLNPGLINVYLQMKSNPRQLNAKLKAHAADHCKEYYYEQRGRSYSSKLDDAAKFIYLNRACFNGIYRVNLKGKFNVPIGSKEKIILPSDDFERSSRCLNSASIINQDFENTIDMAGYDDFIFIDPPYTVNHNRNGFIKYNEKIFSWVDQERLANSIRRASERGAHVLVTNAAHESVVGLYEDFLDLEYANRRSVIASKSSFRGPTFELLGRTKHTIWRTMSANDSSSRQSEGNNDIYPTA